MLSRSPSVVSVALQLPESTGGGSSRLTNKFSSTTTLWLLLRKFESGSEARDPTRNFTARAIPQVEGGKSGPGGLFYETPVINVMGRELVSFTDLQKTLAQLGFNSGSVLLRLSFRATETPLEEAMMEIDQYFKSVEGENNAGAHASDLGNAKSLPESDKPILDQEAHDQPSPPEPQRPSPAKSPSPRPVNSLPPTQTERLVSNTTSSSDQIVTGPSQRPITVFAPPSASTPAAALHAYNEKDYEPTIDHAKLHQSRLATFGRNRTLPSDSELTAQAEAQAKKKAAVRNVKIKIRFPDQSTVVAEFSNMETNQNLYEHVRGLMENENEPFSLTFSTEQGPKRIPTEGNVRLISELEMEGNILVSFLWEEGASSEARSGKTLKDMYREKATQIEVKEPESVEVDAKATTNAKGKGAEKREGEKKGGIPKWLKLPGKK